MAPDHGSHRLSLRVLAVTAAVASAMGLAATSAAAAPPNPAPNAKSFPGSVPKWAQPNHKKGKTGGAETVEGEIYFALSDAAGAKALADNVSTPGNPDYGHYLKPQDWIKRYAPAKASVDATVKWLSSQGLTITDVPKSRLYVVFRGTADQINAAFNTTLEDYTVGSATVAGPSSAPQVPTALGDAITAVSVDQGRLLTHPQAVSPDTAGGGSSPAATTPAKAAPCSSYWGQNTATLPEAYGTTQFPTNICGYTPSQLQGAYGTARGGEIDPGAGAGQTVAIIDAYASPSIEQDTNQWSVASNVPVLGKHQYTEIVPKSKDFVDQALCGQPSGWQGEQTLDVQSVHGIAPGADILYVGGFNCGGGLDVAMSTVLDGHLANIVSNSYGNVGEALPDNVLMGEQNLHLQAAAEGIGLYFSSGDSGDETAALGSPSPDFPASSPYVTAVGGTSLAVSKQGGYLFETGWGSAIDKVIADANGQPAYASPLPGTFRGGAGGGTSAVFPQPAYQAGLVPAPLANGHRVSPDVASLADPYTGYRIGIRPITDDSSLATGGFGYETYGGTSLACPLTAAQMAVAQASSGKVIGFANPAIYGAAAKANSLHDVVTPAQPVSVAYTSSVSGNTYLVGMDHDTSLSTAPGYDDVTGLGSMTEAFAQQVAAAH